MVIFHSYVSLPEGKWDAHPVCQSMPKSSQPCGQLLPTFQQSHRQSQQRNRHDAGTNDANDVVKDESELKAHRICLHKCIKTRHPHFICQCQMGVSTKIGDRHHGFQLKWSSDLDDLSQPPVQETSKSEMLLGFDPKVFN